RYLVHLYHIPPITLMRSFSSSLSILTILVFTPCFFSFTPLAPTEIYTLSLHDALPIFLVLVQLILPAVDDGLGLLRRFAVQGKTDRKSTRLNSSHVSISYAVFCLKKKTSMQQHINIYIFIDLISHYFHSRIDIFR